jgi:hypothetical protein
MTDIPHWWMRGDWFDVCSCDIACPCEFAQPPTNNRCEGVLAYKVREGAYGDVRLDGLNVLGIGQFTRKRRTARASGRNAHADCRFRRSPRSCCSCKLLPASLL